MSWDKDDSYSNLVSLLAANHGIVVGPTLGKGTFSCVVVATRKEHKYALKTVDTRSQSDYVKRFLPREIELVKAVNHQNIVKVDEVISIGSYVNFVTEYCQGGDVLQKIQKLKRIPEMEAKGLFRQLLEALMYLESKEIVHRDIKCENVFLDKYDNIKLGDFGFARYLRKGEMAKTFCGSRAYVAPEILRAISYEGNKYLESKEIVHRDIKCENVFLDKYDNIKLGDFGFARYLRKGEMAKTFCGSRAYVAPEILRAISYEGNKTDIWSAGIVLFVMVTGVMPYDDREPKKMLEKQLQHKIHFPSRVELSTPLKQFIYTILHPYPPNRPSCKELFEHVWIKATTPMMKTADVNNNTASPGSRRSPLK